MRLIDGQPSASATDLLNWAACERLLLLDWLALLDGGAPDRPDVIALRKGREREAAYIEDLQQRALSAGASFVDVTELAGPRASREAKVAATREAISSGPDLIYQAALYDGNWGGYADLLVSVARDSPALALLGIDTPAPEHTPTAFPHYEPVDIKSGRSLKPPYVMQVCAYGDLLARMQQQPPHRGHVVLAGDQVESFQLLEYAGYVRHLVGRMHGLLGRDPRAAELAFPEPRPRCQSCHWLDACTDVRSAADDLSQVAFSSRLQRRRLKHAGIETMTELAALAPHITVPSIADRTLTRLRTQAALQVEAAGVEPGYALLVPDGHGRGFARLPPPNPGDIFFDFEGFPYHPSGALEYLWGWVAADDGQFHHIWVEDEAQEKLAWETFIDDLAARVELYPKMHVFHYAPYEITAMKRLRNKYATRIDEFNELLREGVFVDLYTVLRQAMQVGFPSYSIKYVQRLYGEQHNTAVASGSDSMEEFDRYLTERDPAIKQALLDYNAQDCHTTQKLRDWMLERKAESAALHGDWPAALELPDKVKTERNQRNAIAWKERDQRVEQLRVELLEKFTPAEKNGPTAVQRTGLLLADLVQFYDREDGTFWGNASSRKGADAESFLSDNGAIACLTLISGPDPVGRGSHRYVYTFPNQDQKLRKGWTLFDTDGLHEVGKVHEVVPPTGAEPGQLVMYRGPTLVERLAHAPHPTAVLGREQISNEALMNAVEQVAAEFVSDTQAPLAQRPAAALMQILGGQLPRLALIEQGGALYGDDEQPDDVVCGLAERLDASYLLVQGPPGTGKSTITGATIAHLLASGKRVGIMSNGYAAIQNLLMKVDEAARGNGLLTAHPERFCGAVRLSSSTTERPDWCGFHAASKDAITAVTRGPATLVTGTAWLFASDVMRGKLDYLVIDEAGQVSLANLVAAGRSAKNIILVGDPQQLPQPTQAAHPPGAGLSPLEHLLGDVATVPATQGVFLRTSYRLHPQICEYISDAFYDGRLAPAAGTETRVLSCPDLPAAGLAYAPVTHEGCRSSSEAEVEAIAELYERLLGGELADGELPKRALSTEDILVVAPYNTQVRLLQARLPDARVGTVDKFQGQEAPVVLYSMTCSSKEEAPRGLEFLLDPRRFNVAISRAQCLSVLFMSPQILLAAATSIQEMRLLNNLCLYTERAQTLNVGAHA